LLLRCTCLQAAGHPLNNTRLDIDACTFPRAVTILDGLHILEPYHGTAALHTSAAFRVRVHFSLSSSSSAYYILSHLLFAPPFSASSYYWWNVAFRVFIAPFFFRLQVVCGEDLKKILESERSTHRDS
jgi:hypothetical protein